MIHIYQVLGKLGDYIDKTFLINGQKFKTFLSSDALRRYLEKREKEVRITFFIPESLLVAKELRDYENFLSEKGISDFELVKIPSVGEYSSDGVQRFFISNVDAIMVAILLKIVEDRPEIFYIDISTGQNIYTTQLLEAARNYLLYRNLETILQSEQVYKAYVCFVPPITPDVQVYNVEIENLIVNTSFTLPDLGAKYVDKIEYSEIPVDVKRMLQKRMKTQFRFKKDSALKILLEELKNAYNAIKLNIPLTFYQILSMETDPESVIGDFIEYTKRLLDPVYRENYYIRLPINARQIVNTLLSISLYSSIKKFKHTLTEPEIDEIRAKFGEIYGNKKLGLKSNNYFLDRDLRKIREITSKNKSWLSRRGELLGKLKSKDPITYSPKPFDERNFFAHSGFLDDCTIVSDNDGRLYVKWVEKEIPRIRKILIRN